MKHTIQKPSSQPSGAVALIAIITGSVLAQTRRRKANMRNTVRTPQGILLLTLTLCHCSKITRITPDKQGLYIFVSDSITSDTPLYQFGYITFGKSSINLTT